MFFLYVSDARVLPGDPVSLSSWNRLMAVRSMETDQRGEEEGELGRDEWCEGRSGQWRKEGGRMDVGMDRWGLAAMAGWAAWKGMWSAAGPKLGQPPNNRAPESGRGCKACWTLLSRSTTHSTFHTCLISSACSTKAICFRIPHCPLTTIICPASLQSRVLYFHASASL